MFWTIVLSLLIFGTAARIIYRRLTGATSSCAACKSDCGVKEHL